jgi:hypothetical protein
VSAAVSVMHAERFGRKALQQGKIRATNALLAMASWTPIAQKDVAPMLRVVAAMQQSAEVADSNLAQKA